MRSFILVVATSLSTALFPTASFAQATQSVQTGTPRLISISGVFQAADGRQPASVEEVTVAVYADETEGASLWQETQSIAVAPDGSYSLLLGATNPEGIPLDVFASGEGRWLGFTWSGPGAVEGPRTRLTTVPYALSASNAETLGGRPASAYMLAPSADGAQATSGEGSTTTSSTLVDISAVNPGTTNFIAKYVNASDVGNSAIWESGGRVGINTGGGASDYLHVKFNDSFGAFTGLAVQNTNSGPNAASGMIFLDQFGNVAQFQGFNNSNHAYAINNVASGGSINFAIAGQSRFFVANSGNIGLGTGTPFGPLEVSRSSDWGDAYFTTYINNADASFLDLRHARGTAAAPSATLLEDELASFGGQGYNGTTFVRGAVIGMNATQDWTGSARGTDLRFYTSANATNFNAERMRIDHDGQVGIGTTNPLDALHVDGEVRVNACVRNAAATQIAGTCPSDVRFKRNITSFSPVLRSLTALRPVHYFWRAEEFPQQHFGNSRTYGLIAQEVERTLPELVVTQEDGYKAVDYSKLPLLTIQAVTELTADHDATKSEIETTKSEIKTLKAENEMLKVRLGQLEQLIKHLETGDRRR
jgi:hypothetical protein